MDGASAGVPNPVDEIYSSMLTHLPFARRTACVAFVIATAMSLLACGGGDKTAPVVTESVATVEIVPATVSLDIGATRTLSIVARNHAGGPLGARATEWSTSDATVVTVSPAGVVTGVAAGSAQVTAKVEGKSAVATISVVPVAPASVARVTIGTLSGMVVDETATVQVTTLDAAGNALPNRLVTFKTDNPALGVVAMSGILIARSPGELTVYAESEGRTATATVTVSPRGVLGGVAPPYLLPLNLTLFVGQVSQIAVMQSAGVKLPTMNAGWSSSNSTVATVSTSGIVTALAPGTTTIRAAGGMMVVTVTSAPIPVTALTLFPAAATLVVGDTIRFTTTAVNGETTVPLGAVEWAVTRSDWLFFSEPGKGVADRPGTVTVTASANGKSGSSTVTILPRAASLSANLTFTTLVNEQQGGITITPRDANRNALTGYPCYLSIRDTSVAYLTNVGQFPPLATCSDNVVTRKPGTTDILVNAGGLSMSVPITVTPLDVSSVEIVSSISNSVVTNATYDARAAGDQLYVWSTAGGSRTSGRPVTFTSSDPTVATVIGVFGLLIPISPGNTIITATVYGKSVSIPVHVTEPAVRSVVLQGTVPIALVVGDTLRFTGAVLDHALRPFRGKVVTWSVSDATKARISTDGLVTLLASGSVTITATCDGKSATRSLTVQ